MPGFDTNRFVDLTQSEKSELICSICQDILRCAVVTNCCLQSFCDDCINDWIQTNNTCPYDRKSLTTDNLSRAPRAMMNMLGKLRIRCDFRDNGCNDVMALEDLSNHLQQCQYVNKECEKCFCRNIKSNHDCVEYLLDTNNEITIEANQLRESNVKLLDTNNKISIELNQLKISHEELIKINGNITFELSDLKKSYKDMAKNVGTCSSYSANFNQSNGYLLQQIEELKEEKESLLLTIADLKNEIQSIPSIFRPLFKVDKKAKVIQASANMSAVMRSHAVNTVLQASHKYNIKKQHKEVAAYIAKEFDTKYGKSWNCVIGTNFFNCVSYSYEYYIHLVLGNVGLLLFKVIRAANVLHDNLTSNSMV